MLVGRELERKALSDALAGARVADSRVLVLVGDPGIGKTSLLRDAESAVGEMRVLRARGVEVEQYVPFAGLLQLLRPVLALADHIPEPQRAALATALLLEPGAGPEPSRFAVGAATLSLLARAAEDRPLAVLLDDAHLLDQPSAEAIVFAARRLVTDPVAVLVAARAHEPGTGVWTSLPVRWLTGLPLAESGELLADRLGHVPAERLQRLHEATAGNPLALLELAPHADRLEALAPGSPLELPARLAGAFRRRLAVLDESERTVLLLAASGSTDLAEIRTAATRIGADPRLADPAGLDLTAAVALDLVEVERSHVAFRHPLVQAAVYGAADPATRRAAHRALAAVVPATEPDRLAWHLSRAADGPDESTASLLDRVAAQASARGAHAIASSAAERAAELTADPPLVPRRLTVAGEAAWTAGMGPRARVLLRRALEADPTGEVRARACEVLGAVDTRSGNLADALATVLAAARDAEATDPGAAVRLFSDAVHICFYLGDGPAATRAGTSAEELLHRHPQVDEDTRALGGLAVGMALVLAGSGAAGVARMRGAAYRLLAADRAPQDRFRLPLRAQAALWLRDAGPHRSLLTDAVDRLRADAALGTLPYLLMQLARDAATTDRWADAEAAYTESVRLAREAGHTTDMAVALAGLAVLHARQGREAACQEAAEAAEALCGPNRIRLGSIWVRFAWGDLAAGQGDHAAAVGHYLALERLLAGRVEDPDQSSAAELVESCVQLGRHEEASAHADRLWAQAGAKGEAWSAARAARARALCAGEASEPWYAEALEHHALTPDRYELARTRLAYGTWLRRVRRRVDAREQLGAALETFEHLGAAPWADRAARELQATGATVRRRREPDVLLTPQERQVAQLLARGRTTREAAAALFLSPKTVEYHLRHVYAKLGIRSRAELADRFPVDPGSSGSR